MRVRAIPRCENVRLRRRRRWTARTRSAPEPARADSRTHRFLRGALACERPPPDRGGPAREEARRRRGAGGDRRLVAMVEILLEDVDLPAAPVRIADPELGLFRVAAGHALLAARRIAALFEPLLDFDQ